MKKIAIVGFGFMGQTHAVNVLKNNQLRLVAIVDKSIETIREALNEQEGNLSIENISKEQLNDVNTYQSLDECLQTETLDAVHICVHTNLHYEMTKQVLNKGLHVMVEKPFCLDVEQGKELVLLAKEQGLVLMVAHVVRFMPPYQQLKQWIDAKEYGELKFLSFTRFSGVPQWGQWKEKQADFGVSGGALFDLLIHDIDFASHLLGIPHRVNSFCLPGKLSKHDYVNATWSYSGSSVTVKIEGGNIFHSSFPFQAGFMARFEKASVCYSTLNSENIVVSNDDGITEIKAGDLGDGYFNEIDYFYKCINNGGIPSECLPESSLETIRICYNHVQ